MLNANEVKYYIFILQISHVYSWVICIREGRTKRKDLRNSFAHNQSKAYALGGGGWCFAYLLLGVSHEVKIPSDNNEV